MFMLAPGIEFMFSWTDSDPHKTEGQVASLYLFLFCCKKFAVQSAQIAAFQMVCSHLVGFDVCELAANQMHNTGRPFGQQVLIHYYYYARYMTSQNKNRFRVTTRPSVFREGQAQPN